MRIRAFLLLAGATLVAQEIEEPTLRITVTMVQVDAVVTDKQGKHLTGLKPDDFQVFEDGKQQKISYFSYVPGVSPPPRKLAPASSKKTVTTVVPGGAKATPENTKRTMALVVDDLGLSFTSTHVVKEELRKFVDQQVQPGDLVAILRTGVGIGALQQFTTDKRVLYTAIDRIRWNIRSRTGPFTFTATTPDENRAALQREVDAGKQTSEWTRNAGDELQVLQRQISSVGTLGALSYVIRGLSGLPGRKSVVLFSDGFKIFNRPKDYKNRRERDEDKLLAQLRALTDQANRAAVVIYGIDARGLVYPGITAADDATGSDFDAAEVANDRMDIIKESWDGLQYLARQTGGLWFKDTNDLAGSAAKSVDDVAGYYLLGYSPSEATFKHDPGRGRYHRLRIKVGRPDVRVRTRSGYYGIPDSAKPAAPKNAAEQLADAIGSPFDSGAIGLRLTTLFGNAAKTGSYLLSLLHVSARDLTFTEGADGSHQAKVDVLSFTFGEGTVPEDQRKSTYQIDIKKEDWENTLRWGFLYTLQHPVKKAGAYQVRAAIRDVTSGKVGSASQFVQVPDLAKGGMALSGIMMQSGQTAVDAPVAGPAGGPALRMFRPGEPLYYAFLVYNPAINPETRKPDVQIQARVFRDGEPVWTGPAFSLADSKPEDPRRVKVAQKLNFGPNTPAGEYFIQVMAVDKRFAKRPPVVQWMDFELQPASP